MTLNVNNSDSVDGKITVHSASQTSTVNTVVAGKKSKGKKIITESSDDVVPELDNRTSDSDTKQASLHEKQIAHVTDNAGTIGVESLKEIASAVFKVKGYDSLEVNRLVECGLRYARESCNGDTNKFLNEFLVWISATPMSGDSDTKNIQPESANALDIQNSGELGLRNDELKTGIAEKPSKGIDLPQSISKTSGIGSAERENSAAENEESASEDSKSGADLASSGKETSTVEQLLSYVNRPRSISTKDKGILFVQDENSKMADKLTVEQEHLGQCIKWLKQEVDTKGNQANSRPLVNMIYDSLEGQALFLSRQSFRFPAMSKKYKQLQSDISEENRIITYTFKKGEPKDKFITIKERCKYNSGQ